MISRSIRMCFASLFALVFLVSSSAFLTAQTSGLSYPELSESRRAEIARMLPDKPAGFGQPCSDRQSWERVAQYHPDAITRANTLIAAPLPPWEDQAYLRYTRDGDRDEGQAMLGRHTGQLTPLVVAECSEWKGRFLPRIAEQLDAISAEKSWTLAAHDPQLVNFNGTRYYVDLNAATLGHTVAEALYLLGDKIPPATRQRAMAALELHVFGPMRRAYAGQEKTYIGWLDAKHNWNAVCHNGVTDAALTILPDKNDRALFAEAAEKWVPNYLDSFSDTGYDNEGIGYWVYGFSNYTELREQLWLSTGGKLDLFDNPKARKAALFGFQFAMLPGVYADFGDAHFMYKPDRTFLARVDRIFSLHQFPDDLAIMRGLHEEALRSVGCHSGAGAAPCADTAASLLAGEALPAAMFAAFPNSSERHDPGADAASLLGPRQWYPENGILVDRPNIAQPGPGGNFAITIKAGGNGNHSHNDVGSYSIGMNATQIVGDPGGPSFYIADTFSNKRYTYRLLNSFGHPVPEIDGKLQLEATTVHPTVTSTDFTDKQDTIAMNITPAYDDPNLKKLTRTMRYSRENGGSVELTDHIEVAAPADIVESFPTHGAFKQIDAKTFEIDDESQRLQITIDAPAALTFTQDKVDDMGNAFLRIGAAMHLDKPGNVVIHFHPLPAN